MKKSKNLNLKFLICMSLAVLFLFGVGSAQAGMHVPVPNGTVTMFDAASGGVTFEWDENSVWDIVGKEVEVLETPLPSPTDPSGMLHEFIIPNFYDPLPIKTIEISMVGRNAGAKGYDQARVLDIIGADSEFGKPGPAQYYVGEWEAVDGITIDGGIEMVEWWHIYPNPDFEIVKIFAPTVFELESIKITTQSVVPIPQTILLLGSGLAVLMGLARRRMK